METIETILKNIRQAKRIAIALPKEITIDNLCAAYALQAALGASANKPDAYIFSAAESVPTLPFLAQPPHVSNGFGSKNQLVIKVSNSNAKPESLRYENGTNGLAIYISHSSGEFKEGDVSILPNSGNFDLIIILGAGNFEQLGTLYTENSKLFFETPNINIDINPTNEFYGTVNFVNTTTSSLSELVMDVIESIPKALDLDAVSTSLLAGIISQTSSFRDPKTTPSALLKSSKLVTSGARQQDIIQHLFKTKPLPLLQLWGRALARLTALPEKQFLMAVVTASDLEKTHVQVESLSIVLRDIIEMVTGYSFVMLLAELPDNKGTQVLLAGLPFEQLTEAAKQLGSGVDVKLLNLTGKYDYISFHSTESLTEVQAKSAKLMESRNSVV